jgi:hypothetical protein
MSLSDSESPARECAALRASLREAQGQIARERAKAAELRAGKEGRRAAAEIAGLRRHVARGGEAAGREIAALKKNVAALQRQSAALKTANSSLRAACEAKDARIAALGRGAAQQARATGGLLEARFEESDDSADESDDSFV